MALDVGRIRAVVFDMDDTLLDWRAAEQAAIGALASRHFAQVGLSEREVRTAYDRVMSDNFASWKATRTWWYISDRLKLLLERLELSERLSVQALVDTFTHEATLRLDYLDGALEALRVARSGGRKTALLTNGRSEVQRPKIQRFRLDREVDFVGVTGELGHWKPDAAAFHAVLKPLGVAPENTLMVGDNYDFDIAPARALGMQTAWLNPSGDGPGEADLVIGRPGALVAHLQPAARR